jgi:hypothetical protein
LSSTHGLIGIRYQHFQNIGYVLQGHCANLSERLAQLERNAHRCYPFNLIRVKLDCARYLLSDTERSA